MSLVLPAMTDPQEQAWSALLDVSERLSEGWCLVGGQLVHLHCWERGRAPQRPTDDADAALDVRAHPTILHRFTQVLTDLGFRTAGESMEGTSTGGCAVPHRSTCSSRGMSAIGRRRGEASRAARRSNHPELSRRSTGLELSLWSLVSVLERF